MSTMSSGKLYLLREVRDKGLGVIAATKIAKGTRILSEAALFRVPRSTNSKKQLGEALAKKISALNDNQRQAFLSLHNAFEDEATPGLGIVRTNALPLGSDASTGGIFLDASRINHACIQNAQNSWNEDLQRLTIHAIRDIDEGEEITIMYIPDRANRSARQLVLHRDFRFTCSCPLCALTGPQLGLSNERLDEILRLDRVIGDPNRIVNSPLQALHDVRKLLRLCEEEGINDATIPRAYYDAFQIAIMNGDLARATVFVERAATTRAVLEGHDSPTVRRHRKLAKTPFQHASHGCASQWKTSINDVPSGASAEAFSAWLWKEEKNAKHAHSQKSQEASKYADLRDDFMFPCFEALPCENELDLSFYESTDDTFYHPSKHWCLFAEIVEIETFFLRMRLIVKDKTGHMLPVAFYTPGRGLGEELDPRFVQKGFTVAILYAEQHGFLDMTVGIRVKSRTAVKVSWHLRLNALSHPELC